MPRWMVLGAIASIMLAMSSLPFGALLTTAQEAAPPEPGAIVLEDALARRGALDRGGCPSGRNVSSFVPEGLRLGVTGTCVDSAPVAVAVQFVDGLSVPDGEVRLEARAVAARERVQFAIAVRLQQNNDRYAAILLPSEGIARLVRFTGDQAQILAERTGLGSMLADWTTVAIRLQGPNLWLLIDDQPVLTATDSAYADGRIWIALIRTGDVADSTEAAVVLRNLRVSQLAAGEAARAPRYQAPPALTPPALGAVVLEDPLTQPGVAAPRSCPTGRAGGDFVGEGYMLKVRGLCGPSDSSATAVQRFQGLTVPDGEVKLDLRTASGAERARFFLRLRLQADNQSTYYAAVEPARGWVQLLKIKGNNPATALAQQGGLRDSFSPDRWTGLALRVQGPKLWLLIDDEPVLAAEDPEFESGGIDVSLRRLGGADDDEESAVVIRNLRVTGLAEGDPARAPTYQRP